MWILVLIPEPIKYGSRYKKLHVVCSIVPGTGITVLFSKVPEDVHGLCAKDAVYFSMHKFIGGAQTPGVLVAKKRLFTNPTPHAAGGGTVFFVTGQDHRYVQEVRYRHVQK
jgi:hypothetical protein